VTFDPDADLEGNPTPLNYTVQEEDGDESNEATLTVTYVGAAVIPEAIDDQLEVDHYGPTPGSVVENDIAGVGILENHTYQLLDENGERVPYGQIIPTEHGTVSMELDGTYIYTPETNYNGPDVFDYVIIDEKDQEDPAIVDVTVDCASTQTSDSGDTLGTISMLMIIFMTTLVGLYFVRREEMIQKERESRNEKR